MTPDTKHPYCEGCRLITLAETIHYCKDCIKPLLRVARAAKGDNINAGSWDHCDDWVELEEALNALPEGLLNDR